jgi:hypothetical protein
MRATPSKSATFSAASSSNLIVEPHQSTEELP